MDRYRFLRAILDKLEEEAWQTRADSGWTDHDLEIMGNRWSRLRLTTVTEELDQNRRTFRCRLEPQWSLLAKVLFWAVLGVELFVVGLVASSRHWIWMLPMTMPFLFSFLEYEQWILQQSIASLVDEVAAELGFMKLDRGAEPVPNDPAPEPGL
jgi:hypothetical protein